MQMIEINPKICNGKPILAGTRIPITVVLDQLAEGASLEAVQAKYPEVSISQIAAALRYCHQMIEHTETEFALA
jgi:uncharacterized protein (DUF433 family)